MHYRECLGNRIITQTGMFNRIKVVSDEVSSQLRNILLFAPTHFFNFSFRKFAAISNSRKETCSSVLFEYLQIDKSSSTRNQGIVRNCHRYGKIAQNYLFVLSIFIVGFCFISHFLNSLWRRNLDNVTMDCDDFDSSVITTKDDRKVKSVNK